MRWSRRVVLVSSAIALACYAGLAVVGAARLRYAGGEYLYAAAAILALAAIGLALGELSARAFAILFLAVTALGYGAAGFVALREAFSGSGSDWGAVRALVMGLIAVLALGACTLSLSFSVSLLLLGRAEASPGVQAHVAAWTLGAFGVAALGWIAGYHGWYRLLPAQDACRGGGSAGACAELARSDHFSAAERQAFAKLGCERGHAGSCTALAGMLGKQPGQGGDESQVLGEQCERGNVEVCLRYGSFLLAAKRDATVPLMKVCTLQLNRCSQAAKRAEDGGDEALAGRLLEAGCERDDPYSCRMLLRRVERAKAVDREALHRRVCLMTDVNECLPLIRRDAASVCPVICDSKEVNRMQSCDYCGRHAAASGERALAERWWSDNCEKGHQLSCVNLGKLLEEQGKRSEAHGWFRKVCDPPRGLTLGCSHLPQ